MFEQLPDGVEQIAIQPIVIPRGYDKRQGRLHFYIVFSLLRHNSESYHPFSLRGHDAANIPACLTDEIELADAPGKIGSWPSYVQSLIRARQITLRVYTTAPAAADPSELAITLHRPEDLAQSGWTSKDADALWRRMIAPAAQVSRRAAEKISRRSTPMSHAAYSRAAAPKNRNELQRQFLENAVVNPWSATDLRPGLRLESINTPRVAVTLNTFIVKTEAGQSDPDVVTQLQRSKPDFLNYVRERDADGELAALLNALQRREDEDPRFFKEILPRMRPTEAFQRAAAQLVAWRQEFLLAPGRSEFLRQNRFVDSSRHRVPAIGNGGAGSDGRNDGHARSGTMFASLRQDDDDTLRFEQRVARLRQHPGLMRRLFLTVRCSAEWNPRTPQYQKTIEGGAVGIASSVEPSPFACLTTKTKFDLECESPRPYFRPAPEDRLRFFGRSTAEDEARDLYRQYHTLSTELYVVSQEDPSLAMLRASQDVSGINKSGQRDGRILEAEKNSSPASNGVLYPDSDDIPPAAPNDALHRINAVNIYHRAFGVDNEEIPYAKVLFKKSKQDLMLLQAYNQHVQALVVASRRSGGPFRLASLRKVIIRTEKECPCLFYADNLMMGYSVFVQPVVNGKAGGRWRSLNRRAVELRFNNDKKPCLTFEEEGFLVSSIVVPPRPLVGTAQPREAGDSTLSFHQLGSNNVKGELQVVHFRPSSTSPTRFINSLAMFNSDRKQDKPYTGDVVLVGLEGKQDNSPSETHPSVADTVWSYPVLRAVDGEGNNNDVFIDPDASSKTGVRQFQTPVALLCRNENPGGERPRDWRACITYAPHFTRLVDDLGRAIVPETAPEAKQARSEESGASATTGSVAPRPKFVYFTAETVERNFAFALGAAEEKTRPASDVARQEPLCPVMTNLGPINQVAAVQLGDRQVSHLSLPDPQRQLVVTKELVNPLPLLTEKERAEHVRTVACLPGAKLHVLRGWVREIGFVFALNIQKKQPNGDSHEIAFTKPDGTAIDMWYATKKLQVKRKAGNEPEELPQIRCDARLVPQGVEGAIIVVRGEVKFKDGKPEVLKASSLEYAAPPTQLNVGSIELRWTLDMTLVKGGSIQTQFDADADMPVDHESRLVHPLDAGKQFVEVITDKPGPRVVGVGWPQRPLGSLVKANCMSGECSGPGAVYFADGSGFGVTLDKLRVEQLPASGFFEIAAEEFSPRDEKNLPKLAKLNPQPLLIAAEVSHVNEQGDVELTDSYGQNWQVNGQGDLALPLNTVAFSVRRLRHLLPGEWLVAACHLAPSVAHRALKIVATKEDPQLAEARVMLYGQPIAPQSAPISGAAEGGVEYRPCTFRSIQERELTVWGDAPLRQAQERITAWSQRLLLAETLTQYEPPTEAQAPRAVDSEPGEGTAAPDATAPGVAPHHAMVSELIARWANWGLGLSLPGRADEQSASPASGDPYTIRLTRPDLRPGQPSPLISGKPPFDRESWLLPALRFDRRYRFCLRRVDLAGNHLYEDAPLPAKAPPSMYAELQSLISGQPQAMDAPGRKEEIQTTELPFRRANLPVAPLVAFTPDRFTARLLPPVGAKVSAAGAANPAFSTVPAVCDVSQAAGQFLYLPSDKREPALVLLSDVLDHQRTFDDDATLELLPPPIDVETMLLHGRLDGCFAPDVYRLISRHERYLDLMCQALGRMKSDGELNYLPDPMASCLSVKVSADTTEPASVPAAKTFFFDTDALGAGRTPWPQIRWVRLALRSIARPRHRSLPALPLVSPQLSGSGGATTLAVYLPPGVTGRALLSVRPPHLRDEEYARMLREYGSEARHVRLVHATNGAWTRPIWNGLNELQRDPEEAASPVRDLSGELAIDWLTTGACSVTAYWNDPWDELVPAQHEPARAVIDVNNQGQAIRCRVLENGFGFGTKAVLQFESDRLPYRKPTFKAVLHNRQLQTLAYIDPGKGCNVLFRIEVGSATSCCCRDTRPALAHAWHDKEGKLIVQILDRGHCLGPRTEVRVTAERPPLPELAVDLHSGIVKDVRLISPGIGPFVGDLYVRIFRQPPFYRVAEGRVAAFTTQRGLAAVEILEGGGWYAAPPYCIAHDPSGDGFGAELTARLDEYGGVIGVSVRCPGRFYSPDTRIAFYNQVSEIPEQVVPEPKAGSLEDPFELSFQQAFPDSHARRVDYVARAMSRFRQYLDHDLDIQQSNGAAGDVGCELSDGKPLRIWRHVPRMSPVRQLEVVSHERPVKPEIRYMMPAFAWQVLAPQDALEVDEETYFQFRDRGRILVRRDARIRIYLERPWHATGPEQLAVVVAPAVTNTTLSTSQSLLRPQDGGVFNPASLQGVVDDQPGYLEEPVRGYAIDDNLRSCVSRWGYDPVWNEAAFPPLTIDHFPNRRPVMIYDLLAPCDGAPAGQGSFRRPVWLAVHDVSYDSAKDLWYADIQVDVSAGGPFSLALPFVRLGLAKYQQNGLAGKRLSPIALCDMYKVLGRRELEVVRHSTRKFNVRLQGEFDQTPRDSEFPRREVVVQLEARDPELSPDIVFYSATAGPRTAEAAATGVLARFSLTRNRRKDAYSRKVEFSPEVWNSAQTLHGKPSIPVLSVIEYEIFLTSESQTDSTGTELLILDNRLCARRMVYSSSFQLSRTAEKP